jgi:hypothetical protein
MVSPASISRVSKEPILRFFSYHDAHPVAMCMALLEKFGPDWFLWEGDTLKKEITETFKASSISEHNWQKLQAVRTLSTTSGYWLEWEIFEKIIQALNNNVPRFDIGQRCSIPQLMAGVDIASTIRDEPYSEEIIRYIAACAIDDGVTYLPEPLEMAQPVLTQPMYECLDCGNLDKDDLEDGRCDFCCGRYQDLHNINGKPMPGVPDDVGKNIKRYDLRNPQPAKERFEEVKRGDRQNLSDENTEDVQAVKLMVGYNYMLKRRKELANQLKELETWMSK